MVNINIRLFYIITNLVLIVFCSTVPKYINNWIAYIQFYFPVLVFRAENEMEQAWDGH